MIRIIPAIDIIDGNVVSLRRGDFNQTKHYTDDPVSVAKMYQDAGIQHLHLVDLDGAKSGRIVNLPVLAKIGSETNLRIDFGGGIRSERDIRVAFDNGAHQVTMGSIAVKQRELVLNWLDRFGPDKIILGADVIEQHIAISAWQDKTQLDIFTFIDSYIDTGIHTCICTDVSRDGVLQGPALELYNDIKEKFPDLFLIASGGVSNINDVEKLDASGIDGVIIGKALLEENIKLEDLSKYIC